MGHRLYHGYIIMAKTTRQCLWVLTILMRDGETLAGVGLIVSHTGAAVWLKAMYGCSYQYRGAH